MSTLTRRAMGGLAWMSAGKAAYGVLQLGVLAILGRLLTPTDFGVLSAALMTIAFSNIISQLGLGPAIVQRPMLEARHVRTAFAGSAALGLVLAILLWAGAPHAARFFGAPRVEPVLRTLVVVFPLQGIGVVADSLARRELQFRWLSTLDVKAYGFGYGVVAVSLALSGFGIWALVCGEIAQAGLRTIVLLSRFPPPRNLVPDRSAVRDLAHFGAGFTIAKIANFFAVKGDNLVVGHLLGPAALGIYGRAYTLMAAPTNSFGTVLDHVLFPTMARVQSDLSRMRAAYRRATTALALLVVPASGAFLVLAPEIVRVLLGDRWTEVVPPLRVLAIAMVFHLNSKLGDSVARATGAVYRRAWRQVLYAVLVIGGAYIGSRWGIAGVAACVSLAIAANFVLMNQLSLSLVGMTRRELLAAHVPAVLVGAVSTLTIGAAASGLRAFNAPAAITLGLALLLALAVVLGLMRNWPQAWLSADVRWALDLAETRVPARLAGLLAARRPPVRADLPQAGGTA